MTRRPLLAAALCATLTLTACNNSPKAGQPNTTAPSTTPTPTPTNPTWTPEQFEAITAAKARYAAARAAVDQALMNPSKLDRGALERAGNGGEWITTILGDATNYQKYGWYRSGKIKIASTQVTSVKLDIEQPEVRFTSCLDSSSVVTRFQKDNKPVPQGGDNGKRHKFSSQLVFAPPAPGGSKIWFLVSDKPTGPC